MLEEFPSRAGAFGRWWRIFDEVLDPRVVRQSTPVSCHSACGEMLSEGQITQAQLLEVLGEGPQTMTSLVNALNSFGLFRFEADVLRPDEVKRAIGFGTWIAFVLARDSGAVHAVLVERWELHRITVLDPWEGTQYGMDPHQFLEEVWTGVAIWREE